MIARGEWKPAREDATLVGVLGDDVWKALRGQTRVRQVYAVLETWAHITSRRVGQIEVSRARELLPALLEDPLWVTKSSQRESSVLFVGSWDEASYLVAAVKPIRDELWLATMYKTSRKRLERALRQGEVLYKKAERAA